MGFRDVSRPKPRITGHLEVHYASPEQVDAMRAETREQYQHNKDVIDDYVERKYGDDPFEQVTPPSAGVCPYCGCLHAEPLVRSGKCPACGEKIVLRTVGGEKYALTAEQAELVDKRKKLLVEHRAAFRRVQNVGCSAEEFVSTLVSLGPGCSARDASWKLLNHRVIDATRKNDFGSLKMAYHAQAIQLRDEGRDPIHSLANCLEAETLEYRNYPNAIGLEILSCECGHCSKDKERKLRWDEFERGQFGFVGPIPHAECEKGFCTCSYVAWMK